MFIKNQNNDYNDNNKYCIRNVMQPSDDGKSIDCYSEQIPTEKNMHRIAGVMNHFFYLLAQGTCNGCPSKTCKSIDTNIATGNSTTHGIGKDNAVSVTCKALTNYVTRDSTFDSTKISTVRSIVNLFGENSVEHCAVLDCWEAVGVV